MPREKNARRNSYIHSQLDAYLLPKVINSGKMEISAHMATIDEHGALDVLYNRPFVENIGSQNIASLSKQFTGAAIASLILNSSYNINLTDRVNTHIPSWPSFASRITITHLLNHTSGLPNYTTDPANLLLSNPKQVISYIKKHPKRRGMPRSTYSYNNTGYVVLARIVELITGQKFHEYMSDTFFKPLHMNSTFYKKGKKREHKIIKGHIKIVGGSKKKRDNGAFIKARSFPADNMPGDGGLFSTARDLSSWGAFLAGKTSLGTQIPDLVKGVLYQDNSREYAMGLKRKNSYYHHSGRWNGVKCECRLYPSPSPNGKSIWMSVLANRDTLTTWRILDLMKTKYDETLSLGL